MQYIDVIDYLLLPVYIFLFYFVVKRRALKYEDTGMGKLMLTAFFLHMFGALAYCLMIQYYYGYGDSFIFYSGSNFLRAELIQNPGNISHFFDSSDTVLNWYNAEVGDASYSGYYGIDSNLFIMKISAILSFVSFNSYVIISLFFGFFAFIGLWKLFCAMNEVINKKGQRILAIAVLYTPSLWFWGSGLMKDSVCIGAIGLIVYYLHKFFVKRKFKLRDPFLFILLCYFLFMIKSYLASALLVSAILAYTLHIIIKSKKNLLKLAAVALVVLIGTVTVIATLSANLDSIIEDSKANIEIFRDTYANSNMEDERSMASFSGATIGTSLPDIILSSPVAFFTTLFRPFIWDTKKPVMLFSALESLVLLLATLYVLVKCHVYKFFFYIFSDPYLLFCFVFSVTLGIIIGFSTFNFGTLVRYRLPILPFYSFMLLAIYIKNKEAESIKK